MAAFDGLLAQLRQHVQRERAFVQDAAHELRTPMAAIAAQAHVLTHTPDPEERRQAGSALDHALDRAAHLSRQLLDLAALDDAHPRQQQPVDVAQLVQQALARAAPQALALGLELSLDAPERLKTMEENGLVQRCLYNERPPAARVPPDGQGPQPRSGRPGASRLGQQAQATVRSARFGRATSSHALPIWDHAGVAG